MGENAQIGQTIALLLDHPLRSQLAALNQPRIESLIQILENDLVQNEHRQDSHRQGNEQERQRDLGPDRNS